MRLSPRGVLFFICAFAEVANIAITAMKRIDIKVLFVTVIFVPLSFYCKIVAKIPTTRSVAVTMNLRIFTARVLKVSLN